MKYGSIIPFFPLLRKGFHTVTEKPAEVRRALQI